MEAENKALYTKIDRLEKEIQAESKSVQELAKELLVLKEVAVIVAILTLQKYLADLRAKVSKGLATPPKPKKAKEKIQEKIQEKKLESRAQMITKRLMEELAIIGPKYTILLQKLLKEIEVMVFCFISIHFVQRLESQEEDFKAREKQLLNLLVQYNNQDDPYCKHIMHYEEQIYKKAEQLAKLEKAAKM